MGEVLCSGQVYTLPFMNRPGVMVLLGTIVHNGGMRQSQLADVVGSYAASRAVKLLTDSGWVRKDDGVLVFAGSGRQFDALQSLLGVGYLPVLRVRDAVRSSAVSAPGPVRIFGSFASRLAGVPGALPGDVDVLVPYLRSRPEANALADAIHDACLSSDIDVQVITRSVAELEDGDSFWGSQMRERPWLDTEQLPDGVVVPRAGFSGADADPVALFRSASQMRVVAALLADSTMSLAQLQDAADVSRSRLLVVLKQLGSWVSVKQNYRAKVVSLSLPASVRSALAVLLPRKDRFAEVFAAAGASGVWAFGDYADWHKGLVDYPPRVNIAVVNDQGWSVSDALRIVSDLDTGDDANIITVDPLEWDAPSQRHVLQVKKRSLQRLL